MRGTDMIEILAEALVLEATERAGGTGGAWASITDVRKGCKLTTSEFDQACHRLAVKGTATFVPEDNQKTLNSEDRQAAVMIGQACHLVTIH